VAKRPTPPSASPEETPRARRLAARDWLGGIRLSGFMVIMLGLVVLAVGVLVPTVGTYLAQQQKLSAARAAVQLTQQQIDALQAESDRLGDPAYIATQARERLYYVTPGQVLYLVDNDLPADQQPRDAAPVSAQLTQTRNDWMSGFVRSLAAAGAAVTATAPTDGSTPSPTSDATPSP
jgi:cell division protein FtsB